jgi:transcriptional regulator with XRE-family HTH domain
MAILPNFFTNKFMIEKYSELYLQIGTNIRRIRKAAKLTQEKLAKKTYRIDASKISDMENGKEDFMFSTLIEISVALEVDVVKLLEKNLD